MPGVPAIRYRVAFSPFASPFARCARRRRARAARYGDRPRAISPSLWEYLRRNAICTITDWHRSDRALRLGLVRLFALVRKDIAAGKLPPFPLLSMP